MDVLAFLLLAVAVVLFVAGAFTRRATPVDLVSLGLAFFAATFLLEYAVKL